jgi:hypothetical protein
VAAVSLAALIIQDPFFFISQGFLGSLGFDFDIFVPYLKMPAWITETVVSFQFQAGHNWLLNLKSYEEFMERVRSGYFHKPSSLRFNPIELISIGKQQVLSPERDQMKGPKGTKIQKSHVFAGFQMEAILPRLPLWLQKWRLAILRLPLQYQEWPKRKRQKKRNHSLVMKPTTFVNHSINPLFMFFCSFLNLTVFLKQFFKNL